MYSTLFLKILTVGEYLAFLENNNSVTDCRFLNNGEDLEMKNCKKLAKFQLLCLCMPVDSSEGPKHMKTLCKWQLNLLKCIKDNKVSFNTFPPKNPIFHLLWISLLRNHAILNQWLFNQCLFLITSNSISLCWDLLMRIWIIPLWITH